MLTMKMIQDAERPLYGLFEHMERDEQPDVYALIEAATSLTMKAIVAAARYELQRKYSITDTSGYVSEQSKERE